MCLTKVVMGIQILNKKQINLCISTIDVMLVTTHITYTIIHNDVHSSKIHDGQLDVME